MKYILINQLANIKEKAIQMAIDISGPKKFFDDLGKAATELFAYAGQTFAKILGVCGVGVLAWLVFKVISLYKHGNGDNAPAYIAIIVVVLIVTVLLFSFGATGWGLIK